MATAIATLIRRLARLARHQRFERDLAEEINLHRTLLEARLRSEGLDQVGAELSARRLLGSTPLARDASRDVWVWPWLQSLTQDVNSACRLFTRDRGFVITAVLILALGIGMTNAVFTMVNAALFTGLPNVDDRIVYLGLRDAHGQESGLSWTDLEDWRAGTSTFEGLAAVFGFGRMAIADGSQPPEILAAAYVTPNTFRLLDVRPLLGRDFLPEEEETWPGTVILGYALWQTRYGGDPNVLGRVIKADDREVVVVGVMPQGFAFPWTSQYWLPQSRALIVDGSRTRRFYGVIGRLADGVTEAEARADLETLTARLAATYPSTNAGLRPVVGRYSDVQTRGLRTYLARLLIAIALVLLIGCANVASLLLARSAHRAREMAFRMMLGATRWRLIRQLLVESTLLAVLSGVVGLGFSGLVLPFFASGVTKPYWMEWAMDGRVLAALIATCLGTGVLFGIAPALHVSNASLIDVAKDGGRLGRGGARAHRWTTGLLALEVALTLTLLSSLGLVLRGFLILYGAGQAVDATGLMTMQVRLGVERYGKQEQRRAFFAALQEQLTQMPEVAAATLASELPVAGGGRQRLSIDARPIPPGGPPTFVTYLTIDARYFETLGLPLLQGRPFDSLDGTAGHEGAIVNQRFVDMFFPDQNPIGQRIRLSNPNVVMQAPPPVTIVGVSPTVRQSLWVSEQPDPVVYVPLRVNSAYWVNIIVRPRTNVETLVSAVRDAVSKLDPEMPLFDIMSLEQAMARSRGFQRSIVLMLGVFAAIAVLLASIGIYAVTAYAVAQRRHEVGLRMALGARTSDVIALFVGRAMFPLAVGVIAGVAGAAGAGRLLGNWLADRATFDLPTLGAVAMLLSLVTLAAAFLPSRRAARLDPNTALRFE